MKRQRMLLLAALVAGLMLSAPAVAQTDHDHGHDHTPAAAAAAQIDAAGEHAEAAGESLYEEAEGAHVDEYGAEAGAGYPERELIPDPTSAVFWWEMLWTIVVFLVFFSVLSFVVWPRVLKALQAREEKQRNDLASAKRAAAEAQATLAEYKKQLAEARKEAQRLIDQGRADAQRVAAELKEQTQRDLTQMRQRAQQEITAAKEQAIADLYSEAATLATQVAGRILQREISPEDQRQLIDQSLNELARTGVQRAS